MSTDRETTRIVRSWLKTDEYESADRVLDAVLDRIDATPQRRATGWPARRFPEMNNTAKLALAAAAVLVVAFLGIRYLLPTNVGGPGVTPIPAATASPLALPAAGALEPGTYVVDRPDWTPRSFTLTVPDGWSAEDGSISKGDSEHFGDRDVFVTSWLITHVFADACLWTTAEADSLVEVRTSEDLVEAIANQGGHETTGPTAVAIGGYPAQRLDLNFPDDYDLTACNNSSLRLWPGAGPDLYSDQAATSGQRFAIYVVDVDGDAVAIVAASRSSATSTDVAEMEGVVASIRFESAP